MTRLRREFPTVALTAEREQERGSIGLRVAAFAAAMAFGATASACGGGGAGASGTNGSGRSAKVSTTAKSPVAGGAPVKALAIQSDGRIVVTTGSFDLIRYTRNGRLDRSFGSGGSVQGDRQAWGGRNAFSETMAIQADGKIILAGSVQYGSSGELALTDFALARYTPQGRLDPSFGKAGEMRTHLESQSALSIRSIALQRDGKILAGGSVDGDSALVRFTANGHLDPSFGRSGTILTRAYGLDQIALQGDGKIVAAGTGPNIDNPEGFILARYTPAGKLDPSFGSGGLARTGRFQRPPGEPNYLPESAYPEAVAIRPDGTIVVAGSSSSGIALARFTSEGHLDPSFGHGGMTDDDPQRRFRQQNGGVYAAAFQGDGKIVSVGRTVAPHSDWRTNLAVVRHTRDGQLDTSFGDNGVALANLGDESEAHAVAIQRDGTIVAGGSGGNGSKVALARFLPNGRLDRGQT